MNKNTAMFDLLEKHIRSEIELKPELQQQLRDSGTLVLLKKGEYLLREGEVCRHGYFMNKGSMIQLFQHENGKEIVLGFFMNEHYSFVSSPQSYFSAKGSTFGITAIEGIGIHSFIDGIIYTVTFSASTMTGVLAGVGLVAHEFAEGVIVFSVLLQMKGVWLSFVITEIITSLAVIIVKRKK